MTLTLRLIDVAYLDNGAPTEFVLARRGAIVGRSPTCDWCLPDPRNHVSSRHCEIRYEDGAYVLVDASTNGTFLNGASERMAGPHRLADGDRIEIGPFQVVAKVHGAAAAPRDAAGASPRAGTDPSPGWGGWEAHGGAAPPPPPPPAPHGWGQIDGDDGWGQRATPARAPAPRPPSARRRRLGRRPGSPTRAAGNDGWATRAAPPAPPAPIKSPWAQREAPPPPPRPPGQAPRPIAPPPGPGVASRISEGHVVDWARGGFGHDDLGGHAGLGLGGGRASAPTPPPTSRRGQLGRPPLPRAAASRNDGWGPAARNRPRRSHPPGLGGALIPGGSSPSDTRRGSTTGTLPPPLHRRTGPRRRCRPPHRSPRIAPTRSPPS
ncbi:type VI secretion system-associated FHA domain protein [Sphingomonas sp. MMS24-JH45]